MKYDCIIKNGIIVTEEEIFQGDIGILNGKIAAISPDGMQGDSDLIIGADGLHVLAGAIDMHVHFNDPGKTDWEDWACGTMAAAAGGITTVADMPLNSLPVLTDKEAFACKLRAAKSNAYTDYVFWGGLTDNNLEKLPELHEKGIRAFKAFMSGSGLDAFTSAHDGILLEGLRFTAANRDCFIGVHAENHAITAFLANRMKQLGRIDRSAWVDSRPELQEREAIRRFLFLLQETDGQGHICHISIPEGFEMIHLAKQDGARVTGETCAHYLWFNREDFEKLGPLLKCAPPLRSEDNRRTLWEQVLKGHVDCIASDHSPCAPRLKEIGQDDIWKAWGGISSIQCTVPVLLTEGVHARKLPLTALTRLISANPARRLGLYGRKGKIGIGTDADLMLIDLNKQWIFDAGCLRTKNRISPYVGAAFRGKVEKTLVRGRMVFDGDCLPSKGFGRYVTDREV